MSSDERDIEIKRLRRKVLDLTVALRGAETYLKVISAAAGLSLRQATAALDHKGRPMADASASEVGP